MTGSKDKIAIVGAGLMGHGIAQVFAASGHRVAVTDPSEEALSSVHDSVRRILTLLEDDPHKADNICVHGDLESALEGADVVIEAAPEKLELKQQIFRDLDARTAPHVVLASNTSAIPITDIAERARDRTRILGAHFWNPPHFVPLVEVIQTEQTGIAHVHKMMDLLEAADMSPVHVRKDIPGFIGNRLQHALKREAIALVADGVCDAATLDKVVKEGFGSRLGVLGPLEQSDMIGLQLTLDCHEVLIQHLDRTPNEHPILHRKIAAGETGMAAGKGFRAWTEQEAADVRKRFLDHMATEALERRKRRQSARQTAPRSA